MSAFKSVYPTEVRAGDEIQLYVLPATNLLLLRYSAEPRDLMLLWARLKATPTRESGYENYPTRCSPDS